MKLRSLLKGMENIVIKGTQDIDIQGLSSHSKQVKPGDLFFAKKGQKNDGSTFIAEAIQLGAKAVVTDFVHPIDSSITQIVVPSVQQTEALLASRFYQRPSSQLCVIGVTGTNGKTTTTYLVKHLLDQAGFPCGLIGTIHYRVGARSYFPSLTTPDVITMHRLLKEMIKAQEKACVMEVSSHALAQNRVDQVSFDLAIFTNITQDHLDYHQTMQAYYEAKKKLLFKLQHKKKALVNKPVAIVNQDDILLRQMMQEVPGTYLTFGIEHPADLMARNMIMTPESTTLELVYQGQMQKVHVHLIGQFNVYNLLATAGVGISLGFSLSKIASLLEGVSSPLGRLEKVNNPLDLAIFVDYAHTEDALKNILITLRQVCQKRLIVIFGCGGDRDAGKRPLMGKVACQYADYAIVTSDNPRGEDPTAICLEVEKGMVNRDRYTIIVDRKEAIYQGMQMLDPGDVLVIAGRGHEKTQIIGNHTIPFDDVKVAEEVALSLFDQNK